ncbi:MAG: 3-hydroxyacyl-CoA dehydrogenase family protein, partial [Bdellovibrionota bacterium]
MKKGKFKSIGVVGAGNMGAAIAQHFCMKDCTVYLVDRTDADVDRGLQRIRSSLDEAREKKVLSPDAAAAALARVHPGRMESLGECHLVVEAVFEDLAVKKSLLAALEPHLSRDCIVATNTSSFQVSDLASSLKHPERLVGIHYFYHAAKNKLLELI